MPSDLTKFGLPEMLRCGLGIRKAATGAPSMEDALNAVCRFLFDELRGPDGAQACALVRAYKTHPFGKLKPQDREFARRGLSGTKLDDRVKCLTLLATVGVEEKWNDRQGGGLPGGSAVKRAGKSRAFSE